MKKNFVLLFCSLFISLILFEIFLSFLGRYKNLTKNNLYPSEAIYERPHSSFQKHKHPDVNYITVNYFDEDGVKNSSNIKTSLKKNIIAMFGDSQTENIAVDPKFEFSNILNKKINDYEIVNYGVGGYAIDQVFIRYLKYKNHDIKYVFYFFVPGDQTNGTDSIFLENGNYEIVKPETNFFLQIIGKINLTYFAIDSFYYLRSKIYDKHTTINIDNYPSFLANKIYLNFYHDFKHLDNFYNTFNAFRNEVEKNGVKFITILYPDYNHILYFKKAIKNNEHKFKYFILDEELAYDKKLTFKTDNHWNENGNLIYANNLIKIFNKLGIKSSSLNIKKYLDEIDEFYKKNK